MPDQRQTLGHLLGGSGAKISAAPPPSKLEITRRLLQEKPDATVADLAELEAQTQPRRPPVIRASTLPERIRDKYYDLFESAAQQPIGRLADALGVSDLAGIANERATGGQLFLASTLPPPGGGKITAGAKTWIDATGDVVSGDLVKFKRGIFSGSFKRPKFEGYEDIEGKILKESYGDKTGQHTFTIQTPDGGSFRIMGRNLYKHGVMRQQWDDEASRVIAANEKHRRGGNVRAKRSEDRYGPFGQ